MRELNFKPLTAEQIEVRPTDTKVKGKCTLLLYIDSRCAAQILNDTVGVMNWQLEYKDVKGTIYGRLSIWDEERNFWVYKEDTGSEGSIEAEKSLSSDILKRCLARWGCDFLYYTPRIRVDCPDTYYYNDKMTMAFRVQEIEFDGKNCTKLVIVDRFGKVVYDLNGTVNSTAIQQQNPNLIPKPIFLSIQSAKSEDELVSIWNGNPELHTHKTFKSQLSKKKAELREAV